MCYALHRSDAVRELDQRVRHDEQRGGHRDRWKHRTTRGSARQKHTEREQDPQDAAGASTVGVPPVADAHDDQLRDRAHSTPPYRGSGSRAFRGSPRCRGRTSTAHTFSSRRGTAAQERGRDELPEAETRPPVCKPETGKRPSGHNAKFKTRVSPSTFWEPPIRPRWPRSRVAWQVPFETHCWYGSLRRQCTGRNPHGDATRASGSRRNCGE